MQLAMIMECLGDCLQYAPYKNMSSVSIKYKNMSSVSIKVVMDGLPSRSNILCRHFGAVSKPTGAWIDLVSER